MLEILNAAEEMRDTADDDRRELCDTVVRGVSLLAKRLEGELRTRETILRRERRVLSAHEKSLNRERAAESRVERLEEALRHAPTPEHVSHDDVGARSYLRWYDQRRASVLLHPEEEAP